MEPEHEKDFQLIYMKATYATESFYNFTLWSNRQRNPELDMSESSVGLLRYMPRDEEEDLNEFTRMLFYCLLKLQVFQGALVTIIPDAAIS